MQHRGISIESITTSAIAIVNESGIEALTMPKIAKALGVKSQSLYNHVNNLAQVKTYVSIALFKALKGRLLEGMLGLTGEDAIRKYFEIFYQFSTENANLSELLFLPGQEDSEELNQAYRGVIQILYTLLANIISDPDKLQLYTRMLMSLFVGFVLNDMNHFFQDKAKQGKAALDDMLSLVIQTIA